MNLKAKILTILFVASIASAVATGGLLFLLLKYMGFISADNRYGAAIVAAAIVVYMLSSLLGLILLNLLLSRHMIIPAVEREMLFKERRMLTEQLHHSQKMEAVGQLAGSIAHDFNNLLTIIDGYASLIIADPEAQEASANAQEVVTAARKASFITRKLLSFSQKEQNERVLLDLNTTLQDTDKMLTRLLGEKITLMTKPYDEPIYVMADPVQMGQVLMNLAVNARDAMPNGGRISIKIGSRQVNDGECNKPPKIAAGEYAEIAVHDTGTGISEDTVGRIFEPFFTTKGGDKGTGLGLSIVKSIMKENEGFIDVHSKAGSGTTFFMYLPVTAYDEETFNGALSTQAGEEAAQAAVPADTPPPEPAVAASASDEREAPEREPTILLVEDDPMIRTLVAQTLQMQRYQVLLAEEGWEGIKVARNHKGRIDLLFTDVVMPGLGGAELAVAARELYPEIKVLFMSGYSRSQLEEEGVPADAALLEKPFTPDKVTGMVRRLLAE